MAWTTNDIPSQAGRTAIITGANTGLGLETAAALAAAGAHTVLACRNMAKAEAARNDILARPGLGRDTGSRDAAGNVEILELDLSDLDQVATAADEALDRFDRIDLLINNAGVMIPPLQRTAQGHELQFGTNHLGHFALTSRLLERIMDSDGSRVVSLSSNGHKFGRMRWDDVNWHRRYSRMRAYGQSKLANLMFILELDRRLRAAGATTAALAAHPGSSSTELIRYLPGAKVDALSGVFQAATKLVTQPADAGALPTLRAATDPDAEGGQYYGPDGIGEMMGDPVVVSPASHARRADDWSRLWDLSVKLTGVEYPV